MSATPDRNHREDAAKTPAPPTKLKSVEKPTDSGADDAVAPPLRQKTLATALSRSIVIATLIASVTYAAATLLANRYAIVPASGANNTYVYRIDRLTGSAQFCAQQQCIALRVNKGDEPAK
jgi:hypothetical protein